MRTTFRFNWCKDYQQKYNIPKGFLLIKPLDIFRNDLGRFLNMVNDLQIKSDELKDITANINISRSARTLDQNALMWSLYNIEANEQNAGIKGHKDQMITPEQLYQNDIDEYAPKIPILIKKNHSEYIKSEYKVVKEEVAEDENDTILIVQITSSHFDTLQMSQWIERIFNRLAYSGVYLESSHSIQEYWFSWRKFLNDKRILLHETKMTQSEYKALNPICEAHGSTCYIADGCGSLHHIKTRGMGGNAEDEKEYPSNWLHLCDASHREVDDLGLEKFCKKYPHLKYKIFTALKRFYDDVDIIQEKECEHCKSKYKTEKCPYCIDGFPLI